MTKKKKEKLKRLVAQRNIDKRKKEGWVISPDNHEHKPQDVVLMEK